MRKLICLLCVPLPVLAAAETYQPRLARQEHEATPLMEICRKPEWPKSSLRNEETGTVTLRLTVAPTGRILDTLVVKSSGFRDLDKAALVGLMRCKFRPAAINGVPVQSHSYMQYVWTLE